MSAAESQPQSAPRPNARGRVKCGFDPETGKPCLVLELEKGFWSGPTQIRASRRWSLQPRETP